MSPIRLGILSATLFGLMAGGCKAAEVRESHLVPGRSALRMKNSAECTSQLVTGAANLMALVTTAGTEDRQVFELANRDGRVRFLWNDGLPSGRTALVSAWCAGRTYRTTLEVNRLATNPAWTQPTNRRAEHTEAGLSYLDAASCVNGLAFMGAREILAANGPVVLRATGGAMRLETRRNVRGNEVLHIWTECQGANVVRQTWKEVPVS